MTTEVDNWNESHAMNNKCVFEYSIVRIFKNAYFDECVPINVGNSVKIFGILLLIFHLFCEYMWCG